VTVPDRASAARPSADGPRARPPSVDALARSLAGAGAGLPHPLLVDAARRAIAQGDPDGAAREVERLRTALLQPVINGTGVLLHTNLGRAPLATDRPAGYVNLEFDLATGRRSSRQQHAGALLARACGAEAALVVNNGAAAVLIVLAALAAGRPVVVSRGELVEIGGGFRIPEIMALSGARLAEVGTTNRTKLADYVDAVGRGGDTALLLKVHASNYRIEGFVSSVDVADLAGVGPPVAVDLGSGLLDAGCPWLPSGPPDWLRSEPAARQALENGAALVTFSGDKLLGGPQAGVIAGQADLVAACGRHPLYRVARPGALVLSAMQEVALAYLDRTAHRLPFWDMATTPVERLRVRAEEVASGLDDVAPVACASVAGGGALPGIEIPSWGVRMAGDHAAALRRAEPRPVVAVVRRDETVIDLRTVDPADDPLVRAALATALA
jgi:L-seryl-tRNA(Ser) seleniumtransferase